MTDLRDRIAMAVWMRHRADAFAQVGLDALAVPERPIPPWAYNMADAVIAALGLHEETMHNLNAAVLMRLDGKVLADNRYMRRWATNWEADERPVK